MLEHDAAQAVAYEYERSIILAAMSVDCVFNVDVGITMLEPSRLSLTEMIRFRAKCFTCAFDSENTLEG